MSVVATYAERWSKEGQRVEREGTAVVLSDIGRMPGGGDRHYKQLARMLDGRVIVMGPALFDGHLLPPERVRHLGTWRPSKL